MQSDQNFYNRNAVPPLSYQVGGGYINAPMAPTLPPCAKQLRPFNGVELQPFEVCPRNFIIVDQTDNRSRIMFHPALAEKFNYPDFDVQDNGMMKDTAAGTGTENRESSYPMKEDTEDINVLLSLDGEEEEEEEDEDEEEVSTARTLGSSGSSSPDSCSTYGSRPSKVRLSSSTQKSFSCSSSKSERKRQKMKEMMKALRGIVPGGDQMNSAAVLDEAVKYLKSLKVEVKKLGIGNFND
ncbi:Myc-type [Macleaya cordata]|uniref:Myc-type n=1 Tax=Macleaya cordata TaxID=56857 RepID=A0A200R324_MACCD|nr:Myc-type [Macleaya cordata]